MEKAKTKVLAPYLGKNITEKDLSFVTRVAEMMYRIGASREETPYGIYEKPRRHLTDCILNSKTIQFGKYLVSRYICSSKIGKTSEDDCPYIDKISGQMIKIFHSDIYAHRSASLCQSGLVYLEAKEHLEHAVCKGKVSCAGVEHKSVSHSWKQYLEHVEGIIYSMLTDRTS